MWRLSLPLRVHILSPMSQPLSASGDYHQRLRRLSLGTYLPIMFTPLCRCGWAGKIFFWIELRSIPPLGVICITKPIDYFTYRSHSIVLLHVRNSLYYVFHSTYIIYYLHACTRTFVRVPCTCMHLPACTVRAWLLMHATKFTVHVFLYMHSLLYIHSIGIPIGIPRVWVF